MPRTSINREADRAGAQRAMSDSMGLSRTQLNASAAHKITNVVNTKKEPDTDCHVIVMLLLSQNQQLSKRLCTCQPYASRESHNAVTGRARFVSRVE
jgi:hypothetical protein